MTENQARSIREALGYIAEAKCLLGPGSTMALELGCTCPVLDNNHGRGRDDGAYVMNGDCPLHGWSRTTSTQTK